MSRYDELHEAVIEYHKEHPEVWKAFVRFTFDRINHGREHYSVNGVFERIRWEFGAKYAENEFKINNNHRPFYARRFMKMYPEHEGFFRTREQTSHDEIEINQPELTPEDYTTYPTASEAVAP